MKRPKKKPAPPKKKTKAKLRARKGGGTALVLAKLISLRQAGRALRPTLEGIQTDDSEGGLKIRAARDELLASFDDLDRLIVGDERGK